EAAEPAQDFAVVGVGAQVLHSLDAGADGDLYAVHLTNRAPDWMIWPRVPAPWNPTKRTVWRGSGKQRSRWWTTRPPVAMPLAEMITHGSRASFRALDCSTVRSNWTLGWAKSLSPWASSSSVSRLWSSWWR